MANNTNCTLNCAYYQDGKKVKHLKMRCFYLFTQSGEKGRDFERVWGSYTAFTSNPLIRTLWLMQFL